MDDEPSRKRSSLPRVALPRVTVPRVRFRDIWARLRGGAVSPVRAGLSVAVGLFIGLLPIYGLHAGLCALICIPLRLDFIVALAASNVSNPLMAPFIVVTQFQVGSFLLNGEVRGLDPSVLRDGAPADLIAELALGGVVVAACVAPVGAGLTWWLVRKWQARKSQTGA